jgi:hypothetical protein
MAYAGSVASINDALAVLPSTFLIYLAAWGLRVIYWI